MAATLHTGSRRVSIAATVSALPSSTTDSTDERVETVSVRHPVLDERLNHLADTLANHFEAGVEMALHFTGPTVDLPRRVMDALGLEEDWLQSEAAKEVLFGQVFDYHVEGDALEKNIQTYEEEVDDWWAGIVSSDEDQDSSDAGSEVLGAFQD